MIPCASTKSSIRTSSQIVFNASHTSSCPETLVSKKASLSPSNCVLVHGGGWCDTWAGLVGIGVGGLKGWFGRAVFAGGRPVERSLPERAFG